MERAAASGVVGGTVASVTGGNFWDGFSTGAADRLFNDELHPVLDAIESAAETLDDVGNALMPADGIGEIPKLGAEALKEGAAGVKGIEAIAESIAKGHAFEKHVIENAEFSGISTMDEFASHIENVMSNPSEVRSLSNGRTGYWHDESRTVVVHNPFSEDGGSAFKSCKRFFDKMK